MEKGNAFSLGAETRGFVDQADARGPAAGQRTVEVVHGEADVMYARSPFGDELADGRLGTFGLEQLDERLAGFESGDPGTIGVVELDLGKSEKVAVEGEDLVECAHGDPHVGDARCAAGNVSHVSALVKRGAGAEY